VYEGFVHIQRQTQNSNALRGASVLPSVRGRRRQSYDADRDPVFLGAVEGLGVRVIRQLAGERG
jgi:hypothetical protein